MESFIKSILEFIVSLLGTSPDLIQHWTTGRPRLRVVVVKDGIESKDGLLKFEVENVGEETTSLDSVVTAIIVTKEGESRRITFDICESDLGLPAFTPKQFIASTREPQQNRSQVRDKRYVFRQKNGSETVIKI